MVSYESWSKVTYTCEHGHIGITNSSAITKEKFECTTCTQNKKKNKLALLQTKMDDFGSVILNSDKLNKIEWICKCGDISIHPYSELIRYNNLQCINCRKQLMLSRNSKLQQQRIQEKINQIPGELLSINPNYVIWKCKEGHISTTKKFNVLYRKPPICIKCKKLNGHVRLNFIKEFADLITKHNRGTFVEYVNTSVIKWKCFNNHNNQHRSHNIRNNEYCCRECSIVTHAVVYAFINNVTNESYVGQTKAGAVRFYNGFGICHLNPDAYTYSLASTIHPDIQASLKEIKKDNLCQELIQILDTHDQTKFDTKLVILEKIGFLDNSHVTQNYLDEREEYWMQYYNSKMKLINKKVTK